MDRGKSREKDLFDSACWYHYQGQAELPPRRNGVGLPAWRGLGWPLAPVFGRYRWGRSGSFALPLTAPPAGAPGAPSGRGISPEFCLETPGSEHSIPAAPRWQRRHQARKPEAPAAQARVFGATGPTRTPLATDRRRLCSPQLGPTRFLRLPLKFPVSAQRPGRGGGRCLSYKLASATYGRSLPTAFLKKGGEMFQQLRVPEGGA